MRSSVFLFFVLLCRGVQNKRKAIFPVISGRMLDPSANSNLIAERKKEVIEAAQVRIRTMVTSQLYQVYDPEDCNYHWQVCS